MRKAGEWGILEDVPFPQVPRESGTVNCIKDIIAAIETGREPKGNIRLARRSQEMIMGFIESSRHGGARVPLPMENRSLYIGRPGW